MFSSSTEAYICLNSSYSLRRSPSREAMKLLAQLKLKICWRLMSPPYCKYFNFKLTFYNFFFVLFHLEIGEPISVDMKIILSLTNALLFKVQFSVYPNCEQCYVSCYIQYLIWVSIIFLFNGCILLYGVFHCTVSIVWYVESLNITVNYFTNFHCPFTLLL